MNTTIMRATLYNANRNAELETDDTSFMNQNEITYMSTILETLFIE